MRIALLCALLAAGPVWAQATRETPPEPPAKPRPPLNLKLDNPGSFARGTGLEKENPPAKGLPALGGDARRIDPPPLSSSRSESGPYPKDTNPGR